ncbi:MAG: hypothetical protein JW943_08700 [Deltaproteobacteria bacterium]|nr:hypothetical protein [Deltaproteobacteria bacterium]
MKLSPAILSTVLQGENTKRNVRLLFKFLLLLIGMVAVFSVAIKTDGVMTMIPDPQMPIREDAELILIGTYEGEKKFLQWNGA